MKDMKDSDAVKKMTDSLHRELQNKNETIERIQTPNMKVSIEYKYILKNVYMYNNEVFNILK